LLIFYSGIALSDFSDGFDAYNQGDHDTAFKEWQNKVIAVKISTRKALFNINSYNLTKAY
jgi:hypothetical protein